MRIFVDTNIFLDILLKRQNFQDAVALIRAVKYELFEGIIADITCLNIDYIATRQSKTQKIREFLAFLVKHFHIIGADNELFAQALDLGCDDIEDGVQYLLAKSSQCDIIISNDNGFPRFGIDVLGSTEFAKKFLKS